MNSWETFLIVEVSRQYGLSQKEQAILLAKFPDEDTVRTNKQLADRALEDDQLPIVEETVRKQMWTIYNKRFCPKENCEGFPEYKQPGSAAKDNAFLAWLKLKSPDATWVSHERWNALTEDEQQEFSRLAPDFVVELRSKNDTLKELQEKMREYIDNGVRLGWLIDPKTKTVEIYKPGQDVLVLNAPTTISGEDVLPGFVLDLASIW